MLADVNSQKIYTKLIQHYRNIFKLRCEQCLHSIPSRKRELFGQGLTTIVPIVGGGERLGTLVLARLGQEFLDDDLILADTAQLL